MPLREIVQHFNEAAADEENFPSTIDPRIYHVQLILEYFGDLNGKRVLDVGCGKGRFARVLAERYPRASMVGFDLAEAMLRHVPAGVSACAGSMTALPFPAGAFDCAYATESLEHAVEIDVAVAEMCRVVRPGGRIVIIDKNARAVGPAENSRVGEVVRAKGVGEAAGAALRQGVQPPDFVLGRRRAGRFVPGVAGGAVGLGIVMNEASKHGLAQRNPATVAIRCGDV